MDEDLTDPYKPQLTVFRRDSTAPNRSFCFALQLGLSNETALKLSSHLELAWPPGQVCGALTGALMVLACSMEMSIQR